MCSVVWGCSVNLKVLREFMNMSLVLDLLTVNHSGSHNKYESDASTTRGDLYVVGDNFKSQPKNFQTFHDSLIEGVPRTTQYTGFTKHHIARYQDSVSSNPYFFYSPFGGLLVTPAGWSFPTQMMSNHSEAFPDGSLTGDILKSFFSYTGESGNFKYTLGHERIPDNWYRRPVSDFSIPAFLLDVIEHAVAYPSLIAAGGNTGEVNTFTPIDVGNLTGGVYDAATLTQGNNLLCFALQIIQAAAPDIVGSTFSDAAKAMQPLTDQLQGMFAKYACPKLEKADFDLYSHYPGYQKTGQAV